MTKRKVQSIIRKKTGILLDISYGGEKQPNSVRMGPGGDIEHNPARLPFPLPAASVHTSVVVHTLEFIDPTQVWQWFDELHRVMRPGGTVYFSGPYGGDDGQGWVSDPSHRVRVVEQTFAFLDPRLPFYSEHPNLGRPLPKPWHVLQASRVPGVHGTVSYNVIMSAQAVGKPKVR